MLERNHEPWLVMELMEKGSLYNLIHDETFALDGKILLPILRDVGKSYALPSKMVSESR